LKNWLGKTADRYHEALRVNEEVVSYLEQRGVDLDAAHGYRLGVVAEPDPLHEEYRGRLAIPYVTPTGVVSMRFRCLERHDCREGGCAKYIQPKDEPTHVYNVQALHDADTTVGICEGELDAIASSLAGLPAVGIPGATNWKQHWYRLFDDFERVLVLGDGDPAGRAFASKLAHNIPGGEAKVMPAGTDVNSFIQEKGIEAYMEFVSD
jgi:DNA primase